MSNELDEKKIEQCFNKYNKSNISQEILIDNLLNTVC